MTENEIIKELESCYKTMSVYIGSSEECRKHNEAISKAIDAVKEIQQYRSIGTIEECQEAVERQRAKKPMIEPMAMYANGDPIFICPKCREEATVLDPECQEWKMNFCANCGQKLDWS